MKSKLATVDSIKKHDFSYSRDTFINGNQVEFNQYKQFLSLIVEGLRREEQEDQYKTYDMILNKYLKHNKYFILDNTELLNLHHIYKESADNESDIYIPTDTEGMYRRYKYNGDNHPVNEESHIRGNRFEFVCECSLPMVQNDYKYDVYNTKVVKLFIEEYGKVKELIILNGTNKKLHICDSLFDEKDPRIQDINNIIHELKEMSQPQLKR